MFEIKSTPISKIKNFLLNLKQIQYHLNIVNIYMVFFFSIDF